ncbi:MAG: GNAT family N-acetyltransferase [Phycisphaerales bacterium JB063]
MARRFAALPARGEGDRLVLAPGSAADYAALAEHHYRAARPATMMRVLTLRDPAPGVVDRYLQREPEGRPVAVLVESLASLSCKLRDLALCGRYASLPARMRGKLLNQEVRCISRVVVDPRYRGLGLAVRLVRHALASATTPYTEALAAMGAVSPFFEKAGMLAYHRQRHAHDERLLAALASAGLPVGLLNAPQARSAALAGLPPERRAWVEHELGRWYRSAVGRGGGASRDPAEHWDTARQKLVTLPVYYLHDNREHTTEQHDADAAPP